MNGARRASPANARFGGVTSEHDGCSALSWCPDGTAFTEFLGELNNCTDDGTDPPTGVTGGFAGHCDWRLPDITELQTVLDLTQGNCGGMSGPCIDESVFGPTTSYGYWSSTSGAGFAGFAWFVDFDIGSVGYGNELSGFYVRAVRGAP